MREEKGRSEEILRRIGELEAKVAALSGLRETYDSRFTLLTEKVGELRSMMIAQAKESADAKVKAEKALASLEGIKPEEFRAFLMRRDAEIEGIKAKMVTFEESVKALREEMKEYRATLAQFKGLEAILGMSDEVRSNIVRIQQLKDQVEISADKVMTAFMELQRRMKDVNNLVVRVSRLEEMIKSMQKSVSDLEVLARNFVNRADFDKVVSELQGMKAMSEELKNFYGKFSSDKSVLEEIRDELRRSVDSIEKKNSVELKRLQQRLDMLEKAVSRILKILLSAK